MISPSSPCEGSCHPELCNSILSNHPLSDKSYGLRGLEQSLDAARRTAAYLDQAGQAGPLDDCREMAKTTTGELEHVKNTLAAAGRSPAITAEEAETLLTIMSSAAAGAASCLDGLEEASMTSEEAYRRVQEAGRLFAVAHGLVDRTLGKMETARATISELNKNPLTKLSHVKLKPKRVMFFPTDHIRNGCISLPINPSSTVRLLILNVPANQTVTVAKDGSGNFSSVTDAVAYASENPPPPCGYLKIHIKAGVYEENVIVPKSLPGIILHGAGHRRTIITGNRSVADGYTTYQTATLAVSGGRFIAAGIAVMNTAGPEKMQAVAVRNSADCSVFYNCRLEGFQDTLYAHSRRQLYVSCDIRGTVDFIFGRAAAVFQNCTIVVRRPLPRQTNTITAQGKECPRFRSGFSIHLSRVLPSKDLMDGRLNNNISTYLGRPWRNYSAVVVMQSYIDGFLEPRGWLAWGNQTPPSTVYYGEFENYGDGAETDGRVRWEGYKKNMGRTEAEMFTVAELIAGDSWLGQTAIPYHPGLVQLFNKSNSPRQSPISKYNSQCNFF
ncbi:hypothetical protein HPP92_021060 [Vanilla planifolia]|uniref:Pectinesterase n=1 Tax=Vanilla planifolia TaxID=51239 RepID=A0A835UGR7_VANPL|nr:hypothetical protein HPP92_021060 [Vanilla planifolia]